MNEWKRFVQIWLCLILEIFKEFLVQKSPSFFPVPDLGQARGPYPGFSFDFAMAQA